MATQSKAEGFVRELLADYSPEIKSRFTLEHGRKHEKLLLDGRLVIIVPRALREHGASRSARNAAAAVRRALAAS